MSIAVEFKLVTTYESMLKRGLDVAEKRMNTKLKRVANIFYTKMPKLLEENIKKSATYYALQKDISYTPGIPSLKGALGIPDILMRIDTIIHTWANSGIVDIIPFRTTGNSMTGGLTYRAIKSDYSDVLSLDVARALLTSLQGNQVLIPWLEWLLLGGSGYIIRDYIYYSGEGISSYSRTGEGIMEKRPGQGWSIPVEYMGSQEDNFLTQILDFTLEEVSKEIFSRIEKI
jgi:hypothetical protein